MEFEFTAEEQAFREEVRSYLRAELPSDWVGPVRETVYTRDDFMEMQKIMAKKLGAKGWLAITWPKEYGGLARPHMEQIIFNEESAYLRTPGIDGYGVKMLGPTLIHFGSDRQKKKHLGPIVRGEIFWCEGFSEPQAGSDLASLQTRAVRDGDHYVINGQKIWTTGAHRADWCFMMARTDPNVKKQKGISFFLVDLKTPGITVNPLLDSLGRPCANEVFFDDVKVPAENMVGEENTGWMVGNALLGFERSCIEFVAQARRGLDDIIGYVKEHGSETRLAGNRSVIRQRLAELDVEVDVARLLTYRVAWMQGQGLLPDYEAGLAKVFNTELLGRIAQAGMQILGHYGVLEDSSIWAQLGGVITEEYMNSHGYEIAGGASEVMRTMVATRGFGLPMG